MAQNNKNVAKLDAKKEFIKKSKILLFFYVLLNKKCNNYRICKRHFQSAILNALKREIKNVFRNPDYAYASMDFTGVGTITEEILLNSIIFKKIEYSVEDLKDFFRLSNIFAEGMNFDTFKKTFFPHLYLI